MATFSDHRIKTGTATSHHQISFVHEPKLWVGKPYIHKKPVNNRTPQKQTF